MCAMCRTSVATELDHIKALANGGTNADDNLQGLCAECHEIKTLKDLGQRPRVTTPEQHMAWLVAYNENLFDGLDGVRLAERAAILFRALADRPVGLDEPRETWLAAVRSGLEGAGDEPST